jgi:3',5'-nucleoside bisphosphate phosphatase
MAFVDLHVHTHYSDGVDSPSDVVTQAKKNGVETMAITDHDNLGGLAEAFSAAARLGIRVVSGVEISALFLGRTIHILGLGFSPDSESFKNFLNSIYSQRRDLIIAKMNKISAAFAVSGKKPIDAEAFIVSQGRYFNREKAGRYLAANGYVADQEAGFRLVTETDAGVAFKASADQVITAIHAAGGLAILAHPFAKNTSLRKISSLPEDQEKMIQELIAVGLDGFEAYQSEHGPEETRFALALAGKYGTLVSAGSDWHGKPSDLGWDIEDAKAAYPEHVGGLGIVPDQVAPLLGRLGIGNV